MADGGVARGHRVGVGRAADPACRVWVARGECRDGARLRAGAWRRGEASAFSPTEEATARFNRELRSALPGTVWVTGCRSWYTGADGLPEVWPWPPARHRELMREPRLEDYELAPAPVSAAPERFEASSRQA
jgi:hypothetical protein